ncbi:MAG TPA: DNA polymerase IV [Microlunatus sp.]|nr:DNA polymerase IV [Microlunatus sp.]
MRSQPSVLHLDLDAFFAAVEQRDKPSLRGRAVVVGGTGQRGVVATASYEARRFGVRSAMPAHEARRRAPYAAFLTGRFEAYRAASRQVMGILRDLSPVVEPLSLDEAFVDLLGAGRPIELTDAGLRLLVADLKSAVGTATGGLTASVGIGSSKFIAKLATELGKPDGLVVVAPGSEVPLIEPLPVSVIPGVGPVTLEKLQRIGVRTVADLQQVSTLELSQILGKAHAQGLADLAYARDDRPVVPERETKSVSVEDTFETDLVDRDTLTVICARDARQVAARLRAAGLFARTVTLKVRRHDFSTQTRSTTLRSPIDSPEAITRLARGLLDGIDLTGGIRLLGVGVAGLTDALQDQLFEVDEPAPAAPAGAETETGKSGPAGAVEAGGAEQAGAAEEVRVAELTGRRGRRWPPGVDVEHTEHGRGWVWGAGLGRVTVRFETWQTGPGPVRTFADDDPTLHRVEPLPYRPDDTDCPDDTESPPVAAATRPRNSP